MDIVDSTMILTILVASTMLYQSEGQPQVPGFFIFGDSLSDSGNNNNLPASLAKANFLPYGIDFPGGPTGRFTNGRTTVDLIGDKLGLKGYIPAFPSASNADVVKGVNYASGSAGIRPETGFQVGMRISMDEQLQHHHSVIEKIKKTLGPNTTSHLNKCLYSVYVGSNDWMINYFSRPSMMLAFTPDAYADALIDQLSKQLKALYNTGARKIILFGMSPLGCLPLLSVTGRCSDFVNGALTKYNHKLKQLTFNLNKQLQGSHFIWINSMGIIGPNNLENLGLKVIRIPCCGALNFLCLPLSIPCQNRDEYAYWDNAHPTEAANKVLAGRAFNAKDPTDTYPMDIRHLAKL